MTDAASRGPKGRAATVRCPFCSRLNRVNMTRIQDRPRCGDCKRPILLDRPMAVTDSDFDRVVSETEVPVVVDFYADWCGPCKVMAPVLDQLAHDRAGELLVAKLDTDRNPSTASRFGIRGIPTTIVFLQGREAARRTGALSRQMLDALVADAAA